MVLNIAHRGGAALQPENSLAAFRDAVARGCDGAELDVQLSSDGEVIVFHDYRLSPGFTRGADGTYIRHPTPRLKDLSLSDLSHYDIGRADPLSKYAAAHSGVQAHDHERIPLLREVVAVAQSGSKPFHLFIELKTSFAQRDLSADPKELAEKVVALLDDRNFLKQAILVGFDWPGLLHARTLSSKVRCWFTTYAQSWFKPGTPPDEDEPPGAPVLQLLRQWAQSGTSPWAGGYDAVNYEGSILKAIKAAGGEGWFPFWRDATPEAIAQAHALGLKVGAWTVNDPTVMKAGIAAGIDAICTDRPDLLSDVMKSV